MNLTAITDPAELAEKHLVDSLALLPEVRGAATLLDMGSGAGLPGIPLAIALPSLEVTCCDTVAKKVAFVKAVAAELDLRVRGVAARAEGKPEREGLPLAEVVVSRAFAEPGALAAAGRPLPGAWRAGARHPGARRGRGGAAGRGRGGRARARLPAPVRASPVGAPAGRGSFRAR